MSLQIQELKEIETGLNKKNWGIFAKLKRSFQKKTSTRNFYSFQFLKL